MLQPMTENVMVKSRRKAGDFLIGVGIVLAGLGAGLILVFGTMNPGALVVAGLMLVVIGYLKRIAVALESR